MTKSIINWFPGHMAKANRKILETLKSVDLILEVVDARAIKTSSNNEFEKLNKPILHVALKSDLSDVAKAPDSSTILCNTKNKSYRTVLLNKINEVLKPLIAKKKAKGIANPNFYLMVVGLPNVGKSSLINFLANKKIAITGNQPAVTKIQSVLKINSNLFLQDNPGIFFKKIDDFKKGYVLALLNTIKKDVLPLKDVLRFCYDYLDSHYHNQLHNYYHNDNKMSFDDFIVWYSKQRHFIINNEQPDIGRTLNALFDDFASCKITKINYEK